MVLVSKYSFSPLISENLFIVLSGLNPLPAENYFRITEAHKMFPKLNVLVTTVLPFTWITSIPLIPSLLLQLLKQLAQIQNASLTNKHTKAQNLESFQVGKHSCSGRVARAQQGHASFMPFSLYLALSISSIWLFPNYTLL